MNFALTDTMTMAILTAALLMIFAGLFMLVRTRNMLRIILGVEIAMKAVTLLLIFAGVVNGNIALAQSFIVTLVVLEVVVVVVAAGLALSVFRKNGDIDVTKLRKLNG